MMAPTIPIIPIAITIINWVSAATSMCPRCLPSDVDSLTKLLSSLDNSRSAFEFRFELATAFVVVGVIVEVGTLLWDFRKERREYWIDLALFKARESGPPHKPSLSFVIVEVVAAVLVAGGVAGEFWYEERIGVVDVCVHRADNARASLLEKEARTAADNAQLAEGSATTAQKEAKRSGASAVHIGKLESQLSDDETKLRTEVADADLVLSADAAGLTFRLDWFKGIPAAPGHEIAVQYGCDAAPTKRDFAEKLANALRKPGWTVTSVCSGLIPVATGIAIWNKWADGGGFPMGNETVRGVNTLQTIVLHDNPSLDRHVVWQFTRLAAALDARLEKHSNVGDKWLILIAEK